MQKKVVAIAMGGISSEHDVSLHSGAGMLAQLDPDKFIGYPVLMGKGNQWLWPAEIPRQTLAITAEEAVALLQSQAQSQAQNETHTDREARIWTVAQFPCVPSLPPCSILLLALHGIGGEDGRLQGFLEMAGLPFTGSGSFGSTLAMDKIVSKQLYRAEGISTAAYRVLEPQAWDISGAGGWKSVLAEAQKDLGFPLLVKHPKGGSSLGMGIAQNPEDLLRLAEGLRDTGNPLLLEAFIRGREVTCGVLEGLGPLAPTEIRPRQDGFFSYAAKYQSGRTEEITPAPMPEELLSRIRALAWQCHKALRLSVYSRTDMMVADQDIFVLETNNLPGFTPTSILPQQAAHAGISYRDLLTRIIDLSLARFAPPSFSKPQS